MSVSLLSRVCFVLLLATHVCAYAIRDSVSNGTTIESAQQSPPMTTTSRSSRKGKSHGESTVSGFEDPDATEVPHKGSRIFEPGNVGSIINSEVGDPTSEWWPTGSGDAWRPHNEFTVSGFESATGQGQDSPMPQVTAPPKMTRKPVVMAPTITPGPTFTPQPVTSVVVGDKTLTPGGETATVGEGDGATKVHLDESGKPIVVVGYKTSTAEIPPSQTVIEGQTLTPGGSPVTVGSGDQATTFSINPAGETIAIAQGATSTLDSPATQVFSIGDITATAQTGNYQYLIDSSTLAIGHPVTVSGTVISLTTDASGATVLIAGDTTSTLASPAQLTGLPQGRDVQTTVVDGTTQYVIDSQTLAPGHPITLDGTAISIFTPGGSTVLVIGDKTTTLTEPRATDFEAGGLTSDLAVATPATGPVGGAAATTASKKGSAAAMDRKGVSLLCALAIGTVVLGMG